MRRADFRALPDAGLIFTRGLPVLRSGQGHVPRRPLPKGSRPRCGAEDQYGDNCEKCGATYDHGAEELARPLRGDPELRSSEHYFFDLEQQAFLEGWTQSGTLQPEVANKIKEWLGAGLRAWDISRDAPYFGFQIPGSDNKYFYVWLDAPMATWPR